MAVVHNNTTQNGSNGATSTSSTFSHTISNGNYRVLIVCVGLQGASSLVSATFNGVSLGSPLMTSDFNGSNVIFQYYDPPVGTYNVVVTFSSSVYHLAVASSFDGTYGMDYLIPNLEYTATDINNGTTGNMYIPNDEPESGMPIIFMSMLKPAGGTGAVSLVTTTNYTERTSTGGVHTRLYTRNTNISGTAGETLTVRTYSQIRAMILYLFEVPPPPIVANPMYMVMD